MSTISDEQLIIEMKAKGWTHEPQMPGARPCFTFGKMKARHMPYYSFEHCGRFEPCGPQWRLQKGINLMSLAAFDDPLTEENLRALFEICSFYYKSEEAQ